MKEETAKSTTATIKTTIFNVEIVWKQTNKRTEANRGVYCHIWRRMYGAEHWIVPTLHCYPTFVGCMYACECVRALCALSFELLLFVGSVTVVCSCRPCCRLLPACPLLLLLLLLMLAPVVFVMFASALVFVCVRMYVCVFCVLSVLLIADTLPSSNFYFDQYTCSSSNSSWHCYIGCTCMFVCLLFTQHEKRSNSSSSRVAASTSTADRPSRLTSAACFIDVLFCCVVFQYHQISRPIRIDFRSKLRASSRFQRFWKKKIRIKRRHFDDDDNIIYKWRKRFVFFNFVRFIRVRKEFFKKNHFIVQFCVHFHREKKKQFQLNMKVNNC